MQPYYSNIPTYPSSIKKITNSQIHKDNYNSNQELQKRSKSNANYTSKHHNNVKHSLIERTFYFKSTSKPKAYERSKEVNQLNYSLNAKAFDSNISLNGSNVNISLNQSKKRNHSESFSNLPPKNKEGMKIRDKTLDGLKLNFSQDKIKLKKMVTVKVSQNYGLPKKKMQYSLEGVHYTDNNSNKIKGNNRGILEFSNKGYEQPYKLYTEGNTNCPSTTNNNNNNNNYNNDITTVLNTSHQVIPIDCSILKTNETIANNNNNNNSNLINANAYKELEHKLLSKLSQNKTNSKSKKYNTLKGIFEEIVKIIPKDNQALFLKLLSGYHEVVSAFANENKGLKETNEILQNKLFQLEKANISDTNIIKEKDKEIKQLKSKITDIKENPEQYGFSKSTNTSTQMPVSSNDKEINSKDKELIKNNMIIDINKDNLGDLDALYFFDKVQMNTEGSAQHCIPILPINTEQDINRKKDGNVNPTKMLYANILGKFKNTTNSTNSIIPNANKLKGNPK